MHLSMIIPYPSHGTASFWNNGFVRTPADLYTTTTVRADEVFSLQERTCSRAAV